MSRILNASPALLLLVLGIVLVLTGYPQAATIILDAAPGDWWGTCDGVPVAVVVDSTGIVVLPCEASVDVRQVAEWVSDDGECEMEWRK